jgi:hypothetical protein
MEIQQINDDVNAQTCNPDRYIVTDLIRPHKNMIGNGEGGHKTQTSGQLAVCVASGMPFLGLDVDQGSVMIVDEETPWEDLDFWLKRFALGIGYGDWRELPITVQSKLGFRFNRKTELDRLIRELLQLEPQPKLLCIDSVLACLPSGRQGLEENNSKLGIAIRDDLDTILQAFPNMGIMITVHFGKKTSDLTYKEVKESHMQDLVRGHGSIVGEGSDTGFAIFNISETVGSNDTTPTRFVIIPKARRRAVPIGEIYVELREEAYGRGWARLERIPPVVIPPSKVSLAVFSLFSGGSSINQRDINTQAALYGKKEKLEAIEELLEHGVIIHNTRALTYKLNPRRRTQANREYLRMLEDGMQNVTP